MTLLRLPRFAGQYFVAGPIQSIRACQKLIKREARQQSLPIAFDLMTGRQGGDSRTYNFEYLYVFTGQDAVEFKQKRQAYKTNATDSGKFQEYFDLLRQAARQTLSPFQDFETRHNNFKLVGGRLLFDVETGKRVNQTP